MAVAAAVAVVAFSVSVLSGAGPVGSFNDWTSTRGQWIHKNNVFAQVSDRDHCRTFAKCDKWTDYTYEVQARKISGPEGFMVLFRATDTNHFYWWNIGGSGNRYSYVEEREPNRTLSKIPGSVQTGKWYDIKIVVRGPSIKCYLNKKLVHSVMDKDIKAGGIGLACWKTQVQYRNVKVTSAKGRLLYLTRKTYKSPGMADFTENKPLTLAEKARLAALARAAAAAAAKATPKLIEAFEDVAALEVTGQIKSVSEGPGVTQGKAAVELLPEATMHIQLQGADVTALPWLRFDTHHANDRPQGLLISVGSRKKTGYVRPGGDTLAYPVAWWVGRARELPDTRVVKLIITNVGDTAVVLDNLRLEPIVRTPLGAVLWDLGPNDSKVWPGFTKPRKDDGGLKALKKPGLGEHKLRYPDPLTRDFIGTGRGDFGKNKIQSLSIRTPQAKSMAAWAWLTHYGHKYVQPQEYAFRPAVGRAIANRLKPAELLGSKCLLEGADGAWTGQWYSRSYGDHLVTLAKFAMVKGRTTIELGNCQLAALAMAPTGSRAAIASAVKHINGELRQYRRQFSMGRLERNLCKLEPTEAEKQQGLMLFRVPPDEAFTGTWKPRADQRAWAIHDICRPGGTLHIPLAFVPLDKKITAVSFTVRLLRPETGPVLPMGKNNVRVDFIRPVPEVRGNTAISRPWLLSEKSPAIEAGEIGYAWLTVTIPPGSRPDLYKGTWRVNCGRARVDMPVEIEIVGGAPLASKALTVASWRLPDAYEAYSTVYSSLAKPKQKALQNEAFNDVTAAGVNAFVFRSVDAATSSSGKRELSFGNVRKALDRYPFKEFSGTVFFNLHSALGHTKWAKGSADRAHMQDVIAATNELRKEHAIARAYFYFGFSSHKDKAQYDIGLLTRLAAAQRLAGKSCPAAVGTTSSVLMDFETDEFAKRFQPVSALIVNPNSLAAASQISAFKKLGGQREVFLTLPFADRFAMGFYLAALGADGCFIPHLFMTYGGPYSGYSINGHGLVAPRPGGGLGQTVSAFRISQGRDDWELFRQARALADKAASSKVPATEILDVLEEIESRTAAIKEIEDDYDPTLFSSSEVSHAEMDSWRASLLDAMGAVSRRLKPPRR